MSRERKSGDRFGRLILLRKVGRRHGAVLWRCQCDCGCKTTVSNTHLGHHDYNTRSCGCLKLESNKKTKNSTHGQTKTPEYVAWRAMKARCENQNTEHYDDYGGRGITHEKEWKKFENFLTDVGKRPGTEFSLHRKDNDGNYTKDNCVWAIPLTQSRNRRQRQGLSAKNREMTAIGALSFGG